MQQATKKRKRPLAEPPPFHHSQTGSVSNPLPSTPQPSPSILLKYSTKDLEETPFNKKYDELVDQGWIYHKRHQYTEAFNCFREAADAQSPRGWYALADMYAHGEGVPQDEAEAERWCDLIEKAVRENAKNAHAQFALGLMYHNGLCVPQNYLKAYQHYLLAANEDHPNAANNLGCLYFLGLGVRQNYERAYHYFTLAAQHNYPNAQNNLGIFFRDGIYVPQNYWLAQYWFNQAALQGFSDAQYNSISLQLLPSQPRPPPLYSQFATLGMAFFQRFQIPRNLPQPRASSPSRKV